jgi:hypothetical protein
MTAGEAPLSSSAPPSSLLGSIMMVSDSFALVIVSSPMTSWYDQT